MAKLNALGSPGVYAITFEDETYNPGTKIVEGTTGQRYASNYMGARSRWWDVSMKQAAYDLKQDVAARQAVQDELAEIRKAKLRIASDVAKASQALAIHNQKMQIQREKFNAPILDVDPETGIGETRTRTRTDFDEEGRARATGPTEGSLRNYTIAKAVQDKLIGPDVKPEDRTPAGRSGLIEGLIDSGDLGADKLSQDLGGFYAVEMDIQTAANRLQAANSSISKEDAEAIAEKTVLKQYDEVPRGRNLANRYRFVKQEGQKQSGTGGPYDKTVVKREFKRALGDIKDITLDDRSKEVAALTEREDKLKAKLEEPLDTDLVERARRIQREKFGPSITQALRELPGNIRERRQARQLNRELRAIERFLDAGGTVEELQNFTAEPEVAVERERLPLERAPTVPGVRPGVGQVPGRFTPPGRFLEGDLTPPPPPAPVGPPRVEPTITETTPATGPARVRPIRVGPPVPRTREEIEAGMPTILPPTVPSGIQGMRSTVSPEREAEMGILGARPAPQAPIDIDEELGDTTLEAMPELEKMQLTSPGREAKPQSGTRKLPKDKPKQRKAKPSDAAQHRAGLLQGFVGASTLLEKPRALDRKTANAESGSPQQFARAIIDAERGKSAAERRPLKELVANVAQQYNQMGDKAGRDAALENTIALYKLFLDEQSLLG
jgi:hypothetical protein